MEFNSTVHINSDWRVEISWDPKHDSTLLWKLSWYYFTSSRNTEIFWDSLCLFLLNLIIQAVLSQPLLPRSIVLASSSCRIPQETVIFLSYCRRIHCLSRLNGAVKYSLWEPPLNHHVSVGKNHENERTLKTHKNGLLCFWEVKRLRLNNEFF